MSWRRQQLSGPPSRLPAGRIGLSNNAACLSQCSCFQSTDQNLSPQLCSTCNAHSGLLLRFMQHTRTWRNEDIQTGQQEQHSSPLHTLALISYDGAANLEQMPVPIRGDGRGVLKQMPVAVGGDG